MRRHRFLLFLAAVFAAKLVVVLQLRDHPLLQPDAGVYESPAYAYFFALVFGAAKTSPAVRIVQIVLGTAAVGCVFAATRVWFGGRAAWMAALFAALTGLFTFYETTMLPSALDPFLAAAALAGLALALTRGRLWLVAAGAAFVLLLLNRPPPVHGGLYFYIGNNAASDGTYRPVAGIAAEDLQRQREDARNVAEASSGRKLDDSGVSDYFYALGRSWIGLHPGDAARHFGRKLALLFNAGHIAASYSYPFYAHDMGTLLAFMVVGPWILLPLGLAGLIVGAVRAQRREYLVWAAFVPLYALGVALFFVTERARLPLLVPLCAGAGALVDAVVFRTGWRPRARIAALAAVLVLAFLTNLPMRRDDGRAEERTRMAEAMVVRDRIDAAEQWTVKAAAIHPRPAEVQVRVGRRLVVHSRPDAAIAHLDRALQIDPSSADARCAMGEALVQARRPREAIPHLRAALQGGVRQSLAGYELARALSATGDRAGALQTLQLVRPENAADVETWNALGQLAQQLGSASLAATFFNGEARARQLREAAR